MRKVRPASVKKHGRKRPIMAIAVIFAFALILSLFCVYVAVEADSDKILRNVYVDDIRIGGMSREQASGILDSEFEGRHITLVIDSDNQRDFSIEELGLMYKTEVIVGEAFSLGKEKSFFKNVFQICRSFFTPARLSSSDALVSIGGDRAADLKEYIESFRTQPTETEIEVHDGKVKVTNGLNGREVDGEKLLSDIVEAQSFQDIETIQAPINILPFVLPDVEEIYRSAASSPHAPYGRNEEGEVTATVKTFDIDAARKIQAAHSGEGEEYEFDIDGESVAVLDDEVMYPDIIGEMTTQFNTGYTTRAHNIKLASEIMDGAELLPGEIFSFNDYVGSRDEEKGYQSAHSYSNGNVVDSIGGGVCQVSSTLYNAALNADLDIVKRSSHSLPVAYLPMGQDAAVSYPSQDFKFKNSSDAPIKISAEVEGGELTVKLLGHKSDYFTDVKIINNTLSVTTPKTTEVKDSSLKPGVRVTKQSGANGYEVESFRVVYKDGVEIKRENLGKSIYKAQDRIINVGVLPEPEPETDPDAGSETKP